MISSNLNLPCLKLARCNDVFNELTWLMSDIVMSCDDGFVYCGLQERRE